MIDAARRLASGIEAAPYAARIGLRTDEITNAGATASVAYSDVLANAQGFLHGGVAASLSIWSAIVATVASDRDQAVIASPLSVSISYLAPARQETLRARARVVSRGRELAHVQVDVTGESGQTIALALVVARGAGSFPSRAPAARASEMSAPDTIDAAVPPMAPMAEVGARTLISPFSQAIGMAVRSYDSDCAVMTMRSDVTEGLAGSVDPGALVSMADTCAALACQPSIDERMRGSATLSLSAVFGRPLSASVRAVGKAVVEDGEIKSALVEVGSDGGDASEKPAMTACVTYRFAAPPSRG